MTEILGVKIPMNPWVVVSVIIFATIALAYLVSTAVLSVIRRSIEKRTGGADSRVYRSLEKYLFPLLIVAGLLLVVDLVPLPPKVVGTAYRLLLVSALLLAVFFSTKTALLILRNVEDRYEAIGNIKAPIEILTKIIFIAVGGMIVLDNLGISLTPLLTTLGIGSLAVAIALQDTLGNFFAGLYIKADRPIQVGHYVRLEGGEEGYVEWVGWRSTRIRMLPNNMVIVPNSKLVQSNITNFYLPSPELAVLVQVGVHYDSDLEKVERVTREVAKEVLQTVPGGVPSFDPFIRYHTFNQSSIDFTVILRGREFVDNFLIKHEFVKRLQDRYRRENIIIPFPIRTVHLKPEGDGEAQEQGRAEEP
ncbi:MAG: mechanosensitive ion channel family protein, partial [Candidatus Binatia bacterium]